MLTDYYVPVILLVSIMLMLFLCYRFQKSTISLPDETCDWSKDHWVTNTSILMSRLSEVVSAELPEGNANTSLHDWLTQQLGKPIKPCDVVHSSDLKFLITHYRNRRHNTVYIYPTNSSVNSK